jgi:hypothetical protein
MRREGNPTLEIFRKCRFLGVNLLPDLIESCYTLTDRACLLVS